MWTIFTNRSVQRSVTECLSTVKMQNTLGDSRLPLLDYSCSIDECSLESSVHVIDYEDTSPASSVVLVNFTPPANVHSNPLTHYQLAPFSTVNFKHNQRQLPHQATMMLYGTYAVSVCTHVITWFFYAFLVWLYDLQMWVTTVITIITSIKTV